MNKIKPFLLFIILFFPCVACHDIKSKNATALFDGETLSGWEGGAVNTWRIENGTILGGSLAEQVPHNDFLCTDRSYSNFVLTLKIKLSGNEGFINSGIQFRSERLENPSYEMIGYQADFGKNFWAGLYDESRRNMTLSAPDSIEVLQWIKINDWNDYKIKAEGRRIRLYINGHQTVDYTEKDLSIPQSGLICIQIHGGGKAEVAVKDIFIEELN